jgi:8-oxo-dGTP diphosphatase
MRLRPAALIIEKNKILLMRYEYNGVSVYNLPGGNHDEGESISETLVRELYEELGVQIEVGQLVLVGEAHNIDLKKSVMHLLFSCKIVENEPVINKFETSAIELCWLEISKLNQINMYPSIASHVLDVLDKKLSSVYIGRFTQPWF